MSSHVVCLVVSLSFWAFQNNNSNTTNVYSVLYVQSTLYKTFFYFLIITSKEKKNEEQ